LLRGVLREVFDKSTRLAIWRNQNCCEGKNKQKEERYLPYQPENLVFIFMASTGKWILSHWVSPLEVDVI
jgi:hypothetical protein